MDNKKNQESVFQACIKDDADFAFSKIFKGKQVFGSNFYLFELVEEDHCDLFKPTTADYTQHTTTLICNFNTLNFSHTKELTKEELLRMTKSSLISYGIKYDNIITVCGIPSYVDIKILKHVINILDLKKNEKVIVETKKRKINIGDSMNFKSNGNVVKISKSNGSVAWIIPLIIPLSNEE